MHFLLQGVGGRYPYLFFLLTSLIHKDSQFSPVLASNDHLIQNGFNLVGVQGFVYPAEVISSNIIPATLIFNSEVKVGERGHPSMPAYIDIRGGKKISEGVIVSPHNKRLVDEILFEMVHNDPSEGEELGLTVSREEGRLTISLLCMNLLHLK